MFGTLALAVSSRRLVNVARAHTRLASPAVPTWRECVSGVQREDFARKVHWMLEPA